MEPKKLCFFLFLSLFVAVTLAKGGRKPSFKFLRRSQFGPDFLFGLGSSAYQMEGAVREGGRGESTWDRFLKEYPGKIDDGTNADVASDQYHRYKEDVKLMGDDIGFNAYRFSISWPRILPKGIRSSNGLVDNEVNEEGVAYYRNLIDELLSKGMTPFVTLFHWDVPQTLEDEYEGFLSSKIVHDFVEYADLIFTLFGDKVKHWATFNEPMIFTMQGYSFGRNAPGRCDPAGGTCPKGDPTREPYKAAHNLLIAHGETAKLYKDYYQKDQGGEIGITLNSNWKYPYSHHPFDIEAAQRALDFEFGWFMEPLTKGDYPETMRNLLGDRLPKFIPHDSQMLLNGTFDYIGINYYTSDFIKDKPLPDDFNPNIGINYPLDGYVETSQTNHKGVSIGEKTDVGLFQVNPRGLKELVMYTKKNYGNPPIYITENGIATGSNASLPLEDILNDDVRIQFYESQFLYLVQAIREGARLKGFFGWSVMDGFEWGGGFTLRFGVIHCDYKDGLKRHLKKSALWFRDFLKT